jgi:glycosyltransferase involved in cell wall biosynthesis
MVMKKHILFIVENASVPNDRRVWNEALAVRDLGYDVSIICPRDGKEKLIENVEGIRIFTHPRPKDRPGKTSIFFEYLNALFWEMLLSFHVFITKRFHLIHAANPPDHLFLIALPFKLFRVKFLFDHHDLSPETYVAKFGVKGFLFRVLLIMEKCTFWTANAVISTNESYKRIAVERGGKNIKDVFVVRNGPVLGITTDIRPDEQLRKGFRYLVGYVGIISQQEGIDNLIRIARYIVYEKRREDIKFIIVGKGPYWQEMVDYSERLKLKDYIWFTGFISDSRLYEILSTVDVCVNPEFSNEFTDKSTMIKIMEYMAFGKPIVQFYTTEGYVSAGSSAVYIRKNSIKEFADALLELLEDQPKRERMGIEGKKRINETLNWQKQNHNLKRAYEHVFAKRIHD